ncbi:amino acid adenylation domain-containing protein, partial [Pseudomonas alabamensis]|uniref:amino acid adenylation domain-containing protein n=1 Tax=Pseudomonas alabamensis TaxID=3064349 RepID=UPI003F652E41
MNAEKSLQLASRFIELPEDKRRLFLERLRAEGVDFAQFPIPAGVQVTDRQALSYAQQRMWFLWQLDPHSGAYNLPGAVRLHGPLDTTALQAAFELLVARHASLRTVFQRQADGSLAQVPQAQGLTITFTDVSDLDPATREARVQAEAQVESVHPFDLEHGPLLRVQLLRLADQEHVLLLTLHHIVSDGWSMNVLIDEFSRSYDALAQGRQPELAALPIQYADYGLWQRRWLEAGEQARQLDWWREQLGDDHPVLELPTDRPRSARPGHAGARFETRLDPALAERLRGFARQHNVSLFMVLLAAFNALLFRYTGQRDIRVGSPVANRNRAELEGLIGFFVNTQVLRTQLDGRMDFASLLQATRTCVLGAQAHQELPFERLVEGLGIARSLSHSPLFQVMYNHQPNVADVSAIRLATGLSLSVLDWRSRTTEFDLSLDTWEQGGQLNVAWTYATDLFDAATVARMADHWQRILDAVTHRPDTTLEDLPLLDEAQARQLRDWGRQPLERTTMLPVHRQFEACAARHPDALALICEAASLTYDELNTRSNRLAHHLIAQGVGPEVLVGIATDRSADLIVSLLAVLKAGGGYVPLDPAYPAERLEAMVQDSGARLIVSQTVHLQRLPSTTALHILCVDQDDAWRELADRNPQVDVAGDHLAYVMFTSGSTGRPKGVAITHQALAGHVQVTREFSDLRADDRTLQFSTFNFDAFVEQCYPALTCGAAVVLRGNALWDSERFYRELHDKQISVSDLSTAYWNLLAKDFAAAGYRDYGRLRQVSIGGEAMPAEGLHAWREAGLAQVKLLNTYGPTEATVCATTLDCTDYLRGLRSIPLSMPIGRVLPGREIQVLDPAGLPAPIGVAGELVIGGELLARGYFGRLALTAERFLPDPDARQPGARLYRTGDLARFTAEGVLEYLGRLDDQVKIRGFRIELGEVEARLQAQDEVREAVVLAQDSPTGAQLAAFVVAHAPPAHDQARADLARTLKARLKDVLPDYMLPAQVVVLDRLPLSPNGKLDRKALPKVELAPAEHAYVPPATALECQIAAIWQEVLKREQVGLHDSFFELGGHSLLAAQVVSRTRQLLGIEVPLRSLFEHARLDAFVAALRADAPDSTAPMLHVDRQGPLPLSYAQERQWFLWQLDPHSRAYHLPAALQLSGRLDIDALQRSFDTLLARHESLRTRFVDLDGQLQQVIDPAGGVLIEQVQVSGGLAEAQVLAREESQRLFDLAHGPLLRVKLLRLAEDQQVLVLTQHHIVSDAWSMRVMVDELVTLYGAFVEGRPADLPALAVQSVDHAVWQRQWMEAGERERQLHYWTLQLDGEQPVLALPTDRPRPARRSDRGGRLELSLEAGLVEGLRHLARQQGVTLFTLLLASFQTLLHRYSGQEDIRVGVPVANRNRVETERLIGFFVNTLVLKAVAQPTLAFTALLQQVRKTVLQAQSHQDLPFEHLVEALQPNRDMAHSPLFQVLFNHQGGEDAVLEQVRTLPGLAVQRMSWDSQTAQFDLTLETVETVEGLEALLVYATDLFDLGTVKRLARHWQNLLRALVADPDQRIGSLAMLDPDEQQASLAEWNPAPQRFGSAQCLHQLIEAQTARVPDAIAVSFDGQQLSYAQLNARANQLARALIEQGIGAETLVGLAVERGLEMIVGLLAILKAGGAYVPLDPAYPEDRLAYM